MVRADCRPCCRDYRYLGINQNVQGSLLPHLPLSIGWSNSGVIQRRGGSRHGPTASGIGGGPGGSSRPGPVRVAQLPEPFVRCDQGSISRPCRLSGTDGSWFSAISRTPGNRSATSKSSAARASLAAASAAVRSRVASASYAALRHLGALP
jgi:hypothetical protein